MADEKEEAAQPAEGESADKAPVKEAKSSKSGLLLVIGIAVLVIVATPVVTVMVVKKMAPAPVVEVKEERTKTGGEIILAMDSIIVNIAETKGTRILKVEPHLVISEQRLADELKANYMALLADRVILAASRKSIDELEGPYGREALKREIVSEINAAIRNKMSGSVTDVYFKEFLIQ